MGSKTMIQGLGAPAYQERLHDIRTKAQALDQSSDANGYSAFVATELFESAKSSPTSQTPVYTRMIYGLAQAVPGQPEVQKALWKTALQVVSQGIPGCASVALAKTLDAVDSQFVFNDPFVQSVEPELNQAALQLCTHNMGQLSQAAGTIASQGLKDCDRYPEGDTYLRNAVADVADLEGWRIGAPGPV